MRQLQEVAAQLRTVYAGENAEAIATKEQEVMRSWKELLTSCEDCRLQITTTTDKIRFTSLVRDLVSWMDTVICQIGTGEKPRCCPGGGEGLGPPCLPHSCLFGAPSPSPRGAVGGRRVSGEHRCRETPPWPPTGHACAEGLSTEECCRQPSPVGEALMLGGGVSPPSWLAAARLSPAGVEDSCRADKPAATHLPELRMARRAHHRFLFFPPWGGKGQGLAHTSSA